ncbi:MAG: hypothetical protein LBQ24_01320 [Candidatus Peribacteria bacterium]|nr:hypothetical protein [Candidatus Peribacteria bacterium]
MKIFVLISSLIKGDRGGFFWLFDFMVLFYGWEILKPLSPTLPPSQEEGRIRSFINYF